MTFRRGWIPAIVAPIAVVVAAVAVPAIADAASPPPAKTAAQVLTLIAGSHDAHYSGTVEQSSDLGLPQLPASMSSGAPSSSGFDATSMIELLTGSHTAQVYVDGESRQRVQLLDTLGERDLIHNGTSVWTYDAKAHSATHLTASADSVKHDAAAPETPQSTTPATVADKLIASITPSTKVSVSTGTFLGHGVYTLTLEPKTSATLVGSAIITVDATTGVPLSTQLDARGQSTPAVSVAFSKVDFGRPGADVFAFTPPKGTTVTDMAAPSHETKGTHTEKKPDGQKPTVIGTDWTSIVKIAGAPGRTSGLSTLTGSDARLLDELTQHVDGGRMLQTSLFTVYLRDDGTVFAGAVPSATLLAAAK
jgi:outer membrane lipoprotein-sorting protein